MRASKQHTGLNGFFGNLWTSIKNTVKNRTGGTIGGIIGGLIGGPVGIVVGAFIADFIEQEFGLRGEEETNSKAAAILENWFSNVFMPWFTVQASSIQDSEEKEIVTSRQYLEKINTLLKKLEYLRLYYRAQHNPESPIYNRLIAEISEAKAEMVTLIQASVREAYLEVLKANGYKSETIVVFFNSQGLNIELPQDVRPPETNFTSNINLYTEVKATSNASSNTKTSIPDFVSTQVKNEVRTIQENLKSQTIGGQNKNQTVKPLNPTTTPTQTVTVTPTATAEPTTTNQDQEVTTTTNQNSGTQQNVTQQSPKEQNKNSWLMPVLIASGVTALLVKSSK